jgi:hypothetical protein
MVTGQRIRQRGSPASPSVMPDMDPNSTVMSLSRRILGCPSDYGPDLSMIHKIKIKL